MKKNLWIAVVLALVLMLGACSRPAAQPAGSEASETAETESPVETAVPTETPAAESAMSEEEVVKLYEQKLMEIRDYIKQGDTADEIPEGYTGIREMMINEEPEVLLDQIGYLMKDLSGDGQLELLIGTPVEVSEDTVSNIFALYTVKDGAVQLVTEGWARSAWFLLQDGTFYNTGSNGAAYAVIGDYAISADGSKLEPKDFYFTYEKTEGNFEDIGVYHNTTGVYDKAQAELMDITTDQLWEIAANYQNNTQVLGLMSLSTLP